MAFFHFCLNEINKRQNKECMSEGKVKEEGVD